MYTNTNGETKAAASIPALQRVEMRVIGAPVERHLKADSSKDAVYIHHGVHYLIEPGDDDYDFTNLKLTKGTAEIHIRFTNSVEMNWLGLPTDWKWIGTELDSPLVANTTYVVAVRNEGYSMDDEGYTAPTVANVAYSYERVPANTGE